MEMDVEPSRRGRQRRQRDATRVSFTATKILYSGRYFFPYDIFPYEILPYDILDICCSELGSKCTKWVRSRHRSVYCVLKSNFQRFTPRALAEHCILFLARYEILRSEERASVFVERYGLVFHWSSWSFCVSSIVSSLYPHHPDPENMQCHFANV